MGDSPKNYAHVGEEVNPLKFPESTLVISPEPDMSQKRKVLVGQRNHFHCVYFKCVPRSVQTGFALRASGRHL